LSALVGPDRVLASARAVVGETELAAAGPYLQPLALSTATRGQAPKTLLRDLRAGVACADVESIPLERLVRVRPRTLLTIAALMGAFYFLLPQLANVDDSFRALGSANWAWLVVSLVVSMATYVFAGIAVVGSVPGHILAPTIGVQVASSFLNRVTPANVGGMTLNVRFLRKSGVGPAEAVTSVGLNSAAGAIVHIGLLALFLTWAGQGGGGVFTIPSSSKLLVAIVALFVLAGAVATTRRGRRLVKTHVVRNVKRSFTSIAILARSPIKLAALFGGSAGVTVAYLAALAAAVAAFHGGLSVAAVGAVYLGSSIVAAAAPTPGGLGALEAALVAGLTGVGMASGPAVAAVLSYRLATYWIPILPGWVSLRLLVRREYV
jgi:undecaprenyl-diphosphatase